MSEVAGDAGSLVAAWRPAAGDAAAGSLGVPDMDELAVRRPSFILPSHVPRNHETLVGEIYGTDGYG